MLSDKTIAIVDYKMGNLRSVEKAFQKVGANVIITDHYKNIEKADKIVLPGVGAFKEGMENLKKLDLIHPLNIEVKEKRKLFLGICLGMQLMGNKSHELEETKGLCWIKEEVVRFDIKMIKTPHIGWNNVNLIKENPLFKGIPDKTDFYFVHSYFLKPSFEWATALTHYGVDFVSSLNKDNMFGCQFHPEKSQRFGLEILKNFATL